MSCGPCVRVLSGAVWEVWFFFSSRRRHTRWTGDWSSDVCSSDLGMALGVTLSAPEGDKFSYDEAYLLGKIKVALGGRVAEEIVFGEITTGAESDIQQLTEIARRMVGRWGMSDAIGPVAVLPADGNGPLLPGAAEASATTQELVDKEVRRIVDEAHHDVTLLLNRHRENLDALADALLDRET